MSSSLNKKVSSLIQGEEFQGLEEIVNLGDKAIPPLSRLVKAGKFSPPFSVTRGRVGWFIEDVDAWLDERKRTTEAKRTAAQAEIESD